jgi:ankyrin repeat protein
MRSTFLRPSCGALLLAGVLGSSSHVIAAGSLFGAIRRNDVAAVKTLVDRGADVKAPDDSGATPLMHAALYAGPECVQLLLDRGADVNAANQYGASPVGCGNSICLK